MKPQMRASFVLCGLVVMAVTVATVWGNLVQDPSFTSDGTPDGKQRYSRGESIGPWVVKTGSVDLNGSRYQQSPQGGNSVDLDGNQRGSIAQTIETEKGVEYVLSFALSGNWEGGNVTKSLEVRIGNLRRKIRIRRPSGWSRQNMMWTPVEIPYTGHGRAITLEFRSRSPRRSACGAVVSDISLAVPEETVSAPSALDTIPVPMPKNLSDFVKNKKAAILLGKSLFWDMQAGSDGKTACASCHWNAGTDARIKNTLHPGAPGSAFGPQRDGQQALADQALQNFRGANQVLASDDFPFHKVTFPTRKGGDDNPVLRDSMEVVGAQGVIKKDFNTIVEGNPVDDGTVVPDPVFNFDGANVRQSTGRNTPTMINAVFNDRNFWDGRANRFFNGVSYLRIYGMAAF